MELEDRVIAGMWGLFIGDALAMPVHWYYGGPEQIRRNYQGSLISNFERSVHPFPQSIMQVSNTGGAGRGSDEGDVIGGVILHDKRAYWKRGGNFHYHHTLQAGENTLEASLVRVLMRSITQNSGFFSADAFREKYIDFMTSPGTHNDTYASTCHRMFFQKWREGVDPAECPGNDNHNVDTMDGLVLPAVVLIAELLAGRSSIEAASIAVEALSVTRRSPDLVSYIDVLAELLHALLSGTSLEAATEMIARTSYGSDISQEVKRRGGQDPMVACYIGGAFPALLHFAYKYSTLSVTEALLASANAGGENVHRGAVLGVVVGAAAGVDSIPAKFREGLFHHVELENEILSFVAAVRKRRTALESRTEL